jgi:1,4-dihydroxy-2-naphthoyl-CoA hydrolase
MFKTKKKINFYDCDPAGILFFGRVYEICHSAYEDLIASFELKENYWDNGEYVVPILNSEAHYHRPIKYGETISIEVKVSKLKSSSFELEYEIKNEAGEKCTAVRTVHIFVDKSTWKKREIKKNVKDGLEKYYLATQKTEYQ